MIERDAQGQPVAEAVTQPDQAFLHAGAHHRAHGIGQDQHRMPGLERQARHLDHLGIHEGLAAGEADLGHRPAPLAQLGEVAGHILRRQVDQRVIGRAAFDVTMRAGDVAQGPGVEPQRLRIAQRHRRARFAAGGDRRVAELAVVGRRDVQIFHSTAHS